MMCVLHQKRDDIEAYVEICRKSNEIDTQRVQETVAEKEDDQRMNASWEPRNSQTLGGQVLQTLIICTPEMKKPTAWLLYVN